MRHVPAAALKQMAEGAQPAIPQIAASLALEHGSDGVLIADMRMRGQPIVHVNPAFERITGYAAADLRYLESFPLSEIKVDRSFVRDAGQSAAKRIIVESVVKLGAELDIRVVAEGIETEAECAIVRALGCSIGQGYLFAAPMDEVEFQKVLDHSVLFRKSPDPRGFPRMLDVGGV